MVRTVAETLAARQVSRARTGVRQARPLRRPLPVDRGRGARTGVRQVRPASRTAECTQESTR